MMDDNGFVTSPKEIHNIIASNHTPSVNPFAPYFGTLGPGTERQTIALACRARTRDGRHHMQQ